ncbi:hypothetical protein C9374_002684 [Naegleria lovaniensis]|uniref:Uncharacterized protein n=1 Tax=Naegleria lovaniensis TaxID=51637 RepID=A0AA88GTY6_NAELO|nr:uncharacterized protein C9374_002684 [Naegleria lovaniensis]KAG2386238.1 hypothetical protein C9374_002684 [Naegleria lovaniensis]
MNETTAPSICWLPVEVFHHIFDFLDYMKDICRDPYLSWWIAPSEEMDHLLQCPTIETFESECRTLASVDFSLLLTCSVFKESIESYKPKNLLMRLYHSPHTTTFKHWYYLEEVQYRTLKTRKLYRFLEDNYHHNYLILDSNKYIKYLYKFVKRRNKINRYAFFNVEHVGMFFDLGKNYTCETFPSTSLDLSLIVQLFPGLKFMTCYVYGMSYYFSSPLPKGMKANFVKYDGSRFLYQYFGMIKQVHTSCWIVTINDIPRHYHHVEILIFILLMHGKYSEAIQFIEKYNTLNQDYFSYLWNIIMHHEVFHRTHTNIAELIHFVLQLKKRFKRISITKFEINTISDFEIVEKLNFTEHIHVMKCLTYQFLKEVSNNNNKSLLTSMIDRYGVPYGYFGLSLLHCNSQWMIEFIQNQIPDYDFNSTARCELGVPFTMQIVPLLKICVNYETIALDPFQLDIDGNNLLHYLCLCYTHGIRSLIPTVSDQNFTELMKQKNKFGLTPSVVSALCHGVTNRDPAELSCEITMEVVKRGWKIPKNYIGLKLTPSQIANLQCRNGSYGVVHDEHYTDIDYRDENGKHPCHYITKYYHYCLKIGYHRACTYQ